MAEAADDDVLELTEEIKEQAEGEEPEDQDEEADELDDEDEDGDGGSALEAVEIDFGDSSDEAAPASESDNSVIRELRARMREKDKELAELRRASKPAKIEVGERPTLASCEYDEDRFNTEFDAWSTRKAKAEAQEAEAVAANEARQGAFQKKVQAFEAQKATLGVDGFDEIEAEIVASLPPELVAGILHSDKPAALMVALQRSPGTMQELAQSDLPKALMMLGKLEDKVQVRKSSTRKPKPDKPIQGTTPRGSDRELKRLEKEAERTGDRTELIRHRRKLRQQA